jgi:hypothetical protein
MKLLLFVILIFISVSVFSTSCTKTQVVTVTDTLTVRDTISIKDTVTIIDTLNTDANLAIQPSNNQYEGGINILSPDTWQPSTSQLLIEDWVNAGVTSTASAAIKFDYGGIPRGATIDNATLYLYSDPAPISGDKTNAQAGTNNACFIQRITTTWVLPTSFTWNNPPPTVTTDEAIIPQSVTSTDNAVVDVTALVNDMQANGNDGFFITLQNQATNNARQFASSNTSDATIHPKLIITYHLQ